MNIFHILKTSAKPSVQLLEMLALGILPPELAALESIEQDPQHHPEGRVLNHLFYCIDVWAESKTGDDYEDMILGLATLCHDMGKQSTTRQINGRWTAHGHEAAGEAPARTFLARIVPALDPVSIGDVVALVIHHMIPTFLYQQAIKSGAPTKVTRSIRRLAARVDLKRLARLVLIDKSGRPPLPQVSPEAEWLLDQASQLANEPVRPKPLIQGRDLLTLGMTPGPTMGLMLDEISELQACGAITTSDQALDYARARLAPAAPERHWDSRININRASNTCRP